MSNPNHDPNTGEFTSGPAGGGGRKKWKPKTVKRQAFTNPFMPGTALHAKQAEQNAEALAKRKHFRNVYGFGFKS